MGCVIQLAISGDMNASLSFVLQGFRNTSAYFRAWSSSKRQDCTGTRPSAITNMSGRRYSRREAHMVVNTLRRASIPWYLPSSQRTNQDRYRYPSPLLLHVTLSYLIRYIHIKTTSFKSHFQPKPRSLNSLDRVPASNPQSRNLRYSSLAHTSPYLYTQGISHSRPSFPRHWANLFQLRMQVASY